MQIYDQNINISLCFGLGKSLKHSLKRHYLRKTQKMLKLYRLVLFFCIMLICSILSCFVAVLL